MPFRNGCLSRDRPHTRQVPDALPVAEPIPATLTRHIFNGPDKPLGARQRPLPVKRVNAQAMRRANWSGVVERKPRWNSKPNRPATPRPVTAGVTGKSSRDGRRDGTTNQEEKEMEGRYCMVRSKSAGVFAGTVESWSIGKRRCWKRAPDMVLGRRG